jgi:predicted RNA polymerase sigma factor
MLFYEQLVRTSPTLGTRTGYAGAVAEAKGAEKGLAALDGIDADDISISADQPSWPVRAHPLQRLGKTAEADAFDRAIGLTEDPAVRQFLLPRRG